MFLASFSLMLCFIVFPAAVVPPGASAAKPQPSYSYSQPGQHFTPPLKVESSPSISAATTNQTWRIMESLSLGTQPKATPVPNFTMSQPQVSSSSSSSAATTSTTNQDFSTVNLSDLHKFFPNISSSIAQEQAASQGSSAPSQSSSSFNLQGSQFPVDSPLLDDDIPTFPSFDEVQARGTLDSLNMDEFEDLLNPPLMGDSGNCVVLGSGQQAVPTCAASQNGAAASQNSSDPTCNPGSTWMNYPTSIVSLLQNEDMVDLASASFSRAPVLDECDELMSADEDRLISIFNSGSQVKFASGHPT